MHKKEGEILKLDVRALIVITIISLPLSIKLFLPPINTEIIYPGEIFIGMLCVYFFLSLIFSKNQKDIKSIFFINHPLTYLVYGFLIINIISCFFSTMPLVSFKAVAVKISYVFLFFFIFQYFIRNELNNFFRFFLFYGISLAIVTIYTLTAHAQFGLNRSTASFVCVPFFNDHTIYAAALVFLTPMFSAHIFFSKIFNLSLPERLFYFFLTILFVAGIYFSFSRGAWISVLSTLLILILILSGLRFYSLLILSSFIVILIYVNIETIIKVCKKNNVDSNISTAGFYEQIFSLTNISNDMSNLERLNRWSCAYRMFLDKPILGFGPGTYQFQYLAYQKSNEMTAISITKPLKVGASSYSWSPIVGLNLSPKAFVEQGNGGSAHSEYFLNLSETGIFSFLFFVGILFASLYSSLKTLTKSKDPKKKIYILIALIGLIAYFTHGLFNNFLDDCKVAFLFWVSIAAIVSIDTSTHSVVKK